MDVGNTIVNLYPTPSFFEHSVKNRATFQRPATHARNIVFSLNTLNILHLTHSSNDASSGTIKRSDKGDLLHKIQLSILCLFLLYT